MTSLGVIGCSVLTNELVHLIRRDPEITKVVVMDTPEGRSIADRLERSKACETVELSDPDMVRSKSFRSDEITIWMNPTDLHDSQEKMSKVLSCQAEQLSSMVDGIFMLYGQCRCQKLDTLLLEARLGIPIIFLTDRSNLIVDDCISASIGGCKRYLELMRSNKGALFVTNGYVEEHLRNRPENDIAEMVDEVERLRELFDLVGTTNVLKLRCPLVENGEYDMVIDVFCRTFGLEIKDIPTNMAIFEDSYDLAKSSMRSTAEARELLEAHAVVWD